MQKLIVQIEVEGGEISLNGIEDALNFYFGSESLIHVKVQAAQQSVQADKSKLPHVGNPCIYCGISQNIPGAVSGVCSCR